MDMPIGLAICIFIFLYLYGLYSKLLYSFL